MARYIEHKGCDNCGSSDARAVYDDDSEYCFSCQDWSSPNKLKQFKKVKEIKNDCISLPQDCIHSLPSVALNWLAKYDLTKDEIVRHGFLWCPSKESLVFPVYGAKGLLMYQMRYFGTNKKYPKYLTKGYPKSIVHVVGKDRGPLVLVEDLISAIKVGRVCNAMPLWGSEVPLELIIRLSKRFSNLVVWLDKDKTKEAIKACHRASVLGKMVTSVFSDRDPKEYSAEEIQGLILYEEAT